jgi:aryl-alcohol dehydrogenase-like predicted oxidoreductase
MKIEISTKLENESIVRIGLGFSKLGSSNSNNPEYVQKRLDVIDQLADYGLVLVDTAPIYGTGYSESVVGDRLFGIRDKVFLATKYFPQEGHSRYNLVKSVDSSLSRLKTESIDLLQLHWPNPFADLHEILVGVSHLIEAGKIRHFGVSNYSSIEMLEFLTTFPNIKVASNQIELNFANLHELSKYIRHGRPLILTYGSLMQGDVTLKKSEFKLLETYARNLGLSPTALAIAIILARDPGIISILRISTNEHLRDILKIFLTDFNFQEIDYFSKNFKPTINFIDFNQIELIGDGFRKPYFTLDEAVKNPEKLYPSPISLAHRILRYNLILPVKVRELQNNNYQIDSKDPFDQIKKYWAWRIAYPNKKVPTLISDHK